MFFAFRAPMLRTCNCILLTDIEAPTFEFCPDDQSLPIAFGQPFVLVEWEDPTATDNFDAPNVTCNLKSRSQFPIGETLVTCVAVDRSDNNSTCVFRIHITGTIF